MVTNQFYYGALMVTLYPTNATGERVDERAVLDPTILTASSDQAVIKEWAYTWPFAWKKTDGADVDDYPTNLVIDIVAPLKTAKDTMPDTISVQVWARFTDIKLSYPKEPAVLPELQSMTVPKVKYPKKKRDSHPADDISGASTVGATSTVDSAIEAISSVTLGDAVTSVSSLASFVTENWGPVGSLLGFLFDKPDRIVCQENMNIEPSTDLFNADIPDTNVSVGMYKGKYVDPGAGRMPMTKNWTVSEYARIPGLRMPVAVFDAEGDSVIVQPIQSHSTATTYKIPLDYSYLSSALWRGSIKVQLMFFTSAFISARFSVAYINESEYPGQYPTDYSNGLSKIINVKGDTMDSFTLPWLSRSYWTEDPSPRFRLRVESKIASSDASLDPVIYCMIWIAGGDDIQFAWPRAPLPDEWRGALPVPEELDEKPVLQAAVGKMFTETFPPISENVFYDIDRGFCTSENLGPITDICKRYSPVRPDPATAFIGFQAQILDSDNASTDFTPADIVTFRTTFFGSWRHAFLFRSGGYRYRHYDRVPTELAAGQPVWNIDNVTARACAGTVYRSPMDGMTRLTIPQLAIYPFGVLGFPTQRLSITSPDDLGPTQNEPVYLAARDDVQFGYPILPEGMVPNS
jgi:hypothetical protein